MARSTIITGAKLVLYVNGRPYGRVTSFRWNSDSPGREIRGIDSVLPFELAPTVARVSGSMTVYRLSGDGGAEGAGLIAPIDAFSRQKYCSFLLLERNTNKIIFETLLARADNQTWDAVARGYLMGNISWQAIGYSNEVRPVQLAPQS